MKIQVTEIPRPNDISNFVVSVNECWFPGSYESEVAAIYAAKNLTDEEAELLQNAVKPKHITMFQIESFLNSNP